MEQPSSSKEEILSRQFESVCKMALDGEAVDYHRQLNGYAMIISLFYYNLIGASNT